MIKRLAILFVLAVLSAPCLLVQMSASPAAAPRRIEIVAKRFAFNPDSITLKKGEPVVLVLKSEDVPHGIRFRELNIEVKAAKGASGEVQFTPDKDGDFVGHCSVFCGNGHGSMTLTLHVIG